MPIAVKKKVENSAQNAWWRIALSSVQPSSTKSAGGASWQTCGEPVENNRQGNSSSGNSRNSATHAENLIGAAPAEMIDQDLRRRQQHQHAGAGRGIHHGHRGRQPRAEPAAEQDRIRNVADQGDTDADAQPEAQLELPELFARGRRSGMRRPAGAARANRRCGARSGRTAGRPAAPRARRKRGQRIDRNDLRAIPAKAFRDRLAGKR